MKIILNSHYLKTKYLSNGLRHKQYKKSRVSTSLHFTLHCRYLFTFHFPFIPLKQPSLLCRAEALLHNPINHFSAFLCFHFTGNS